MRYRRAIFPGATYFFTVNLHNRKSQLLTREINKLRFSFKKAMYFYPFSIEGIVILPDHLHLIMSLPEGDADYALRWNMIKGTFSKTISQTESISQARRKKRERGIWQRRFWEHLIRDNADFEHHMDYIHYNPVKHGYVNTPRDWPYSSIHKYIQRSVLPEDWGCDVTFCDDRFGE